MNIYCYFITRTTHVLKLILVTCHITTLYKFSLTHFGLNLRHCQWISHIRGFYRCHRYCHCRDRRYRRPSRLLHLPKGLRQCHRLCGSRHLCSRSVWLLSMEQAVSQDRSVKPVDSLTPQNKIGYTNRKHFWLRIVLCLKVIHLKAKLETLESKIICQTTCLPVSPSALKQPRILAVYWNCVTRLFSLYFCLVWQSLHASFLRSCFFSVLSRNVRCCLVTRSLRLRLRTQDTGHRTEGSKSKEFALVTGQHFKNSHTFSMLLSPRKFPWVYLAMRLHTLPCQDYETVLKSAFYTRNF